MADRRPAGRPRRVVVVDVDSLRPDHVGAYGYPAPTTPAIDRVAADGTTFENAYAAATPCMPSRAGLVSGRYGVHNGVVTHGPPGQRLNDPQSWPPDRRPGVDHRDWWTLPAACFHERIHSVAVTSFPRHPAPWFHRTWHQHHSPQEPAGDRETFATVRAGEVVERAVEAVGDREEFLLYCQFWEPHVPYRADVDPAAFRGAVDHHPHPTAGAIDDHRDRDLPHDAADRGVESRADLDRSLARYDAQVRAADRAVGDLVEWLKATDRYGDALVVVTADHGEAFGERGVYQHHWSVHEPTQRIPLVVKPPGGAAVDRSSALVTNVDLAPTVAEYLGIDPPESWQGDSLKPLVDGDRDRSREAVVLDHGLLTAQRATRAGRWKLVETLHPGAWGDHLPDRALYDLEADPHERRDRSGDCPGVVDRLVEHRREFLEAHRDPELADPLEEAADAGPTGYRFWRRWYDLP